MIEEEEDESVSLAHLVGGFGLYQTLQYLLALLPIVFAALSNTNFVFAAAEIDYRCVVPECEKKESASVGRPAWWPATVGDHECHRPLVFQNASVGTCKASDFTNRSATCSDWVFSEDEHSFVVEFELACQEWKRAMVGTIHNIGVLLSMPIMGYISDKWGRRLAIIASAVGVIIGLFKTMVPRGQPGYLLYILLELLEAGVVTGCYNTCFVLMLELVGKERRVLSMSAMAMAINVGELFLAFSVWLLPARRHFQILIYLPGILFFSYVVLLNESLRWLLITKRNDEAIELVKKITKTNGIELPDRIVTAIKESRATFDNQGTVEVEKFSLNLLFSSPILFKRLFICSSWWFTTAFVYYGMVIHSVSLPGNKIVNFTLSCLANFPGDLTTYYLLNRFGRQRPLFIGFLLCGIFCIINGFIPSGAQAATVVAFLLGKAAISLCFNCVYVYTSELVPTSARSSFLGVCAMLGRFGSILAPLVPLLRPWWASLPTLLFGSAGLIAAALTLLTPETKHADLPDTVAQAESMK